ncbi:symmetrical bis(5'-nucleosyl)-tetraphosphatase [Sansalvadorimonas sp. 2012CJ34-2]|uniref:Bis(5'-nucleosyl)-tetraphosphatase, symmetrical n=1 Tax=Parendozoicomonas callyspongiae TaxID=2942213 RepID=A0ABT0PKA1_9GAMM|nr:symmetrical bis(5'-nucleosyl)-tetraphosphatase [Sansalvadorimonas sp. 2012CJ34-2]MCL6271803.1 symmetrical bis(5'-nucleosyl)-tetraphosphatase [Sansalvadorimonas sp. 2012CJ34-2]
MTTYAVGDIQGCYSTLRKLLDSVEFDEHKDKLWVAGDLVNRGPESLQTLRYLKQLGKRCKAVLGNHDLHLLAIAAGAREPKRGDTITDILKAKDREELLDWLRHRPLVHLSEKKGYLMVHAGVPPIWDEKKILKRAAELEEVIQGPDSDHFFHNMYGNEPNYWSKDLEGIERQRMIANYFTRMRFCNAKGVLELSQKGNTPPRGYAPWYLHKHKREGNLTIIFGHWAALNGQVFREGYEALDTGCVWGGKLTLMRLKDMKRFSVSPDE